MAALRKRRNAAEHDLLLRDIRKLDRALQARSDVSELEGKLGRCHAMATSLLKQVRRGDDRRQDVPIETLRSLKRHLEVVLQPPGLSLWRVALYGLLFLAAEVSALHLWGLRLSSVQLAHHPQCTLANGPLDHRDSAAYTHAVYYTAASTVRTSLAPDPILLLGSPERRDAFVAELMAALPTATLIDADLRSPADFAEQLVSKVVPCTVVVIRDLTNVEPHLAASLKSVFQWGLLSGGVRQVPFPTLFVLGLDELSAWPTHVPDRVRHMLTKVSTAEG